MKTISGIFLLLAAGIILQSCSSGRNDDPSIVFRYNEPSGISSLDPAYARNLSNIWAVNQIFNGLVELDDQMQVVPSLAHRWEILDDGRLYRFYLRDDVVFHHDAKLSGGQGRKLRASDFVYSFNRIIDQEVSSPGSWVFNEVERRPDGKLQVSAPNDTTLEIRLRQSFPPFLGILTMPYCAVVLPEAVNQHGKDFRMRPVGTGPFRFTYWKEGVKLVLRKNPWYFEWEQGAQLPHLEAVSISFIIDKQAAFLEFIKGNLDFMSGLDPSYQDELLQADGSLNPAYADRVELITQPYLNTEYLGFMLNSRDLPESSAIVGDRRIRQAINYGFDRVKMIRYLRNNIGTPGLSGFIPAGLPGYDSTGSFGYNYDPQKVADLLAEAGYPGGKGLPPITLSTTAEYLDLCKYIQHELEQFGITIKIDVSPPAALKELKAQGKLPFFRASWVADYPDAENYLSLFLSANHCPEGPNYFRYAAERFDNLYDQAMRETDPELRSRLYRSMDSLAMTEAPAVVLYYDQVLRFTSKDLTGLGSNAINLLKVKRVRKAKG